MSSSIWIEPEPIEAWIAAQCNKRRLTPCLAPDDYFSFSCPRPRFLGARAGIEAAETLRLVPAPVGCRASPEMNLFRRVDTATLVINR